MFTNFRQRINAEHWASARCEPCAPYHHCALPAVRGRPRSFRGVIRGPWPVEEGAMHHESSLRPIDRSDSHTQAGSTRNRQLCSCRVIAVPGHKKFLATLTRYGRPSKNRGTPKQDDHADALRARCWFVDSIGWTTVATSPNVMLGPAAFDSRFGQRSARNCQKKDG